jgi:putative cell wall-binding protein
VQRIQGANRYETSQNLASVFYGLDAAPVSYVATGTNFPDALAAGPAAANNGGPVILVPGSSTSADGNTLDLLADLQTQHVVIAGGTAGVSNSYATSLLTPSMPWIGRAAGTNRYETSFLLNTTSFELADTVYLATGTNFPDALSGAAVASTDNYQGPIFLTPSNCVRGDVLTAIEFYQPKDIILLGGTATLSVAVESLTPC